VYSLLLKQFIRSKVAITGIILLLTCGIISLFIGKSFLQKQTQQAQSVAAYQKQHIAHTIQFENKEMGLTLYYLRFALVNNVQPLNGLSIGLRDVNLGIQQVTIRTLEEKKYDTDLNNPASLQMGNFDFSFVLIYLFPLLIIVFCYNIFSEEIEAGTWNLVKSQSKNKSSLIVKKISIRFLSVQIILLLLYVLSIPILNLAFNASFIAMALLGILYVCFWFALCSFVIGLKNTSSSNAIVLLGLWLMLNIVLPAAVNNYIVNKHPIPEALATAVANRDGYHRKWDESKQHTMEKFYAHYPQFTKYKLSNKEFSWLWYYAMQQMGDDDAAEQSQAMKEKLQLRNIKSNQIGYFIPSVHTQLQSNLLAQSGLDNQIAFYDATTKFHESKRLYFYPKIFDDAKVLEENWAKHKVAFFESNEKINWLALLLPTTLFSMLLLASAVALFRISKIDK
jgi:ABC-2 type transport system permease protein